MALRIRLSRGGSKKNPHYRVVIIESTSARDAKAVEIIGHYHPKSLDEKKIILNSERFSYWIGVGAIPSEIVAKLASKSGISLAQKFIPVYLVNDKKHGKSKEDLKKSA